MYGYKEFMETETSSNYNTVAAYHKRHFLQTSVFDIFPEKYLQLKYILDVDRSNLAYRLPFMHHEINPDR